MSSSFSTWTAAQTAARRGRRRVPPHVGRRVRLRARGDRPGGGHGRPDRPALRRRPDARPARRGGRPVHRPGRRRRPSRAAAGSAPTASSTTSSWRSSTGLTITPAGCRVRRARRLAGQHVEQVGPGPGHARADRADRHLAHLGRLGVGQPATWVSTKAARRSGSRSRDRPRPAPPRPCGRGRRRPAVTALHQAIEQRPAPGGPAHVVGAHVPGDLQEPGRGPRRPPGSGPAPAGPAGTPPG